MMMRLTRTPLGAFRSVIVRYKSTEEGVSIFDRQLKSRHRDYSLTLPEEEGRYYDYLREESAARIADRIEDISRTFKVGLELGCHRGHLYDLINGTESLGDEGGGIGGIQTLYQCDIAPSAARTDDTDGKSSLVKAHYLHGDEESPLPFKPGSFDIVLSSLSLHWINDIPGVLKQIKTVLKPDGVFIGSMLGGSTLQELKDCIYLAEQERKGGFSPHASPLALPSDVAGLMQGTGFKLPTIDVDTHTISYPDAFTLMEHLGFMGENNATYNRRYNVGRDTFLAAASIYQEKYGMEDGSVPATFQIIYVIGWQYAESQPKPMKRGSGTHSLKDLKAVKLDKPVRPLPER